MSINYPNVWFQLKFSTFRTYSIHRTESPIAAIQHQYGKQRLENAFKVEKSNEMAGLDLVMHWASTPISSNEKRFTCFVYSN